MNLLGGVMKKKTNISTKILPFLLMPVLFIFYGVFIFTLLKNAFGCGCYPSPNANDVKVIFWIVAALLDIILLIIISRTIKKRRFIYITFGILWIIINAYTFNDSIYAK
jgi:hypothetical protein